jgi:eukaryotic-like serine/threonine-protein kinase
VSVDIPNYRVVEKLGVGAQSSIFRARCMRTGRDYAIKIVKITKPEDTSFVDLLRTEYQIGSSIDHPAVRKIYELRLLRQRLRVRGAMLFMEYIDGISMAAKEFQRPIGEVLRLFIKAAQGLHAMHLAGFVHADLKPNNIMVLPDGEVKLIDLGQSARIREAKPRIQGTIDYMAPEQVQRGVLDERTDVFGIGATLHKVLTGKPIATEMNQTVSMHSMSLVGRRVAEIRQEVMTDLPATVTRLIDDCCQHNPADRIADMPKLIERLGLAETIIARQNANSQDAVVHTPSDEIEREIIEDHEEDPDFDSLFEAVNEEIKSSGNPDDSSDLPETTSKA